VSDEQEIERVLAHYCHRCDDGDFAALLDLFAADAELVYGERLCRGRTQILAFFEDLQGKPDQRGKHVTSNVIVDVADDQASVLSDFLFVRFAGGSLALVFTGRYRDRFARVAGRWCIARREIVELDAPS
jgi:3-phenylpropionate/cinnamic acid dioxygenase small subunit